MKTFIFRNPGVIDPRSISTFGVSSKDNASTAIGFFGTGLKYAIAILLRNGCKVTVYAGKTKYTFSTDYVCIRNDEFRVVTMSKNDNKPQPLSFTTELGKTWEMWQAFREVYCNMLDENGDAFEVDYDPKCFATPTNTLVCISGSAFERTWMERTSVVLSTTPTHVLQHLSVHPGQSQYVYYKGIRALRLERPSRHTYNITEKCELTEDRQLAGGSYKLNDFLSRDIAACEDEELIDSIILNNHEPNIWEHNLSFTYTQLEPAMQKRAVYHAQKFNTQLNNNLRHKLQDCALEDFVTDDAHELSEMDRARLGVALQFLVKMGYPVAEAYPIIISRNLGKNVLGRAHKDKIYIAMETFSMGTKMLAGTILEEYLHLKHGLQDCDRDMQNFLLNALMSLGERATGVML